MEQHLIRRLACRCKQIHAHMQDMELQWAFESHKSALYNDISMQAEVSHRLSRAGHAFVRLNRVWKDQHLSKGVKCSIYKSIVLATLLYGCETWAVTQAQRHDMNVFHMSCLRRICHISLRERRTNDSILATYLANTLKLLIHMTDAHI